MNAYIFAADLWCEGCGAKLREELPAPEGADPEDVLPATPETVRQFIARTGLRMTCKPATGNPNMDADAWGATARHWRCVLHFRRRRLTVPFSQGSAFTEPTIEDVLSCLVSDARGYEDDDVFGDWAVARGYDSDSRHAERIFLAVARQSAKLRRFLGPAEYDALLGTEED